MKGDMSNERFVGLLMLILIILILSVMYVDKNNAAAYWETLADKRAATISRLEVEKEQLNNKIINLENAVRFSSEWEYAGEFKITFYWNGEDEYGSLTATGVTAQEGRTVAVDPNLIPYGTEILIDGHIYVAEDCGAAVKGNIIDIYVDKPKEEMYYTEIYVRK